MDELSETYYHNPSITEYHKYKLVNILIRILKESNSKINVLHAAIMLLDKYVACRKKIEPVKYVLLGHACLSLSNQLFFSNGNINYYILKSLDIHTGIIPTEKVLAYHVNKIALKLQFELIYENPYTMLQKFILKNKHEPHERKIMIMKYVVTCLLYDINALSYDPEIIIESVISFTKIWISECDSRNVQYIDDYLLKYNLNDNVSDCVKHVCIFICKLNMLTSVMRINKNPKYDEILKMIPFLPVINNKTQKIVVNAEKKEEN